MAKPSLLFASLALLMLFHGCLARKASWQPQNECDINRLEALQPLNRIRSEAGTTEWWDPNQEQFRCAGVAVVRQTIEPRGLSLPQFSNAPQLVYIVRGRGIQGAVMPGCPETFQESQEGPRGGRFRDQHQQVRRFREGDIIALPAGVAHWCFNDGNERVVTVHLLDVSNAENQLDMSPRKFHLAGNPEEEQRQLRQMQREGSLSRPGQRETEREREPRYQSSCNNLFCGFDPELLADVFNIDVQTVKKLQNEQDTRGSIVRVREGFDVVRPPRMEEEEREMEHGGGCDNGLEETFCSMRIRENIGDPSRADIYNPQAGRISTVNSHNLPILRWLRLSAKRTVLYRNAGIIPQYCMNAHKILYMIRGHARIQMTNQNGQTVYDGDVQQGQILTIPMNFAVTKRAGRDGADWVIFNTNDNAMNVPLAGRTSAMRALPAHLISIAYQVSIEEAIRLKHNNQETHFITSQRRSERVADA